MRCGKRGVKVVEIRKKSEGERCGKEKKESEVNGRGGDERKKK